MRKTILAAFAILYLASTALPQDMKKEPAPKGLTIIYDKFRDTTLVRTDRVHFLFGSIKLICDVAFGYVKSADATTPRLFLAAAESFATCPLEPDFDVIVLVDGQRFKLGKTTKASGLYPIREYEGGVMVEVPLEMLEAIAGADKWEMAVGRFETKVKDSEAKDLRKRVPTLITQFKKDSAEHTKTQ